MDERKNKEEVDPRKGEDNYEFQFGNMKIQEDNLISHSKALMNYSEQGVANALAFQEKANDLYLNQMDAREKMDQEHKDAREKADLDSKRKHVDNDRYTLDRLYSVFPEEAAGLLPLLKAMVQMLESAEKKD